MGIHAGHRQRVKNKIEKLGLESFADHEVLEALLFYAIPYRDTNPTAHALIDTAGGLADVLRLSPERVASIDGCGARTAEFLALFAEAGRRSFTHTPNHECYQSADALRALARRLVEDFDEDITFLILLDNHFRLIEAKPVFRGYYASASFRAPLVTGPALLSHASMAALVTRHANKLAHVDAYEVETTRYLSHALESVGVHLLEHYVVGGNLCVPTLIHTNHAQFHAPMSEQFAAGGDRDD